MAQNAPRTPEPVEDFDLLLPHEREELTRVDKGDGTPFEQFAEEILAEVDGEAPDQNDEAEVSDEEAAEAEEFLEDEDEDEFEDEDDEEVPDDEDGEADEESEDEDADSDDYQLPEDDDVAWLDEDGNPVTVKQAREGNLRHADYTRKTQEAAEVRKQSIAVQERAIEIARESQGMLQDLESVMVQMLGPEPDPALRATDPGEFAAQIAEYNQKVQGIQGVRQKRLEREQEIAQQEAYKARQTAAAEREALFSAKPEFRDEEVFAETISALEKHFTAEYGYTPEELAQVGDHRALLIMERAMKYDQLQAEGADKVTQAKQKVKRRKREKARRAPSGKPRRGESSKARSKRSERRLSEHRTRLAESGDLRDAAAGIEELLGDALL